MNHSAPVGTGGAGESVKRGELAEGRRGLFLRKKLLRMPHFRDSSRVLLPALEWPNTFSLMRDCGVCVGRSWCRKLPLW